MWISAPYPEIEAPKFGKKLGLVTQSVCVIFSFFWLVHSLSEVLSACKILDGGVAPSPTYGEKTGFAILNSARCNAYSPSSLLGEWPVSHYSCPAAAVD